MSISQKNRRAKERRRKGYKTALEKKCAKLKTALEKKCAKLQDALNHARNTLQQLKETEAVTDAILRGRLALLVQKNQHDREYRLGMRYVHPQEYLADPAKAFCDFAVALGQPPSYAEPRAIRTPEINLITEGTVNYAMSRDYPHLMAMVEGCLNHLAKRMVHVILRKFMEQR